MFFVYTYLVTLFICPQLWIPPFIGWPVDYIVYPTWFLYVLLSGRLFRTRFGKAELFFIALIGWITLSLIANNSAWAVPYFVLTKYLKWFILYVLFRCTVQTPAELRRSVAFMVALVYVLSIEGIQHKLSPDGLNWAGQPLGWVDPAVLEAGGTGRTKWVGVFDGIGVFAVAYTIALPFVLQYTSAAWGAAIRWLNRFALPGLLVALYFTGSRGAFLATLALVCLYLAQKYQVSLKTISIASAVVVVAFMLAPENLTQTRDSSKSAQNRVDVWAQGLGMLGENPLLGVGRGNFVAYTRTIIAHNSAIEIAAETGLVGIFLWLSLIVCSFRAAYLRLQAASEERDRRTLIAVMMSLAGYIVSSMFVTLEYETFYMLMALCVGGLSAEQSKDIYGGREFTGTWAAIVVFVLAIKGLVMIY